MRVVMKVEQVGEDLGVAFPRDFADRIGLKEGDSFFVVEREDGILLTRDENFADAMRACEHGAKRYGGALKALADS